jgi:lipoprotein-anchoring transpeptidase ErfK/SrfK
MKVALTAVLVALVSLPAFANELRLEVSLSEKTLYVWKGNEILQQYDVSVGKPQHPTPKGNFKIRKVIWNPSWVPPPDAKWAKGKTAKKPGDPDNPIKKVKIFFRDPDYYIHGTGELDSIGKAKSHGCIRMKPGEATEVGKLVMKYGGKPLPEPWYRRVLRGKQAQGVVLSKPVPLVVAD